MELEDVRSALIKLYGLLQSIEESLLSASSVNPSGEQSLAGATDKILEDVDYISKEVVDAIKRIKSRLQALRRPAEVVDPLNEKNPADKGSCRKASSISIADILHPPVETKEQIVTRSELSQVKLGQGSTFIAKMNPTRARALNRKDNLPYQAIMRPTRLDCDSSKIMAQPTLYDERTEDQKVRGIHKNIHLGPQSRIVRRQQISEETSSSFGSSSSWTTQQTKTSCNESESESQEYLPPRRRGSPKKQTERLRRSKLGLVFHHHHHNHNNDDDSDHAEAAHAMSLWTHMRKFIHRSNKKKVYDDHSVKKSRKRAVVSNVPSKNQQGQFHSLVEGLMRHVRHSKKSKHSKGGIGRLGNDQRGHNKKVVKKLHWWEMLKRKRGVKLSNKGRVKLGYTSKKPQLRGVKMR